MKDRVVVLKSFRGKIKPKADTADRENYWKLIGEKGKIIDDRENGDCVLVQFQCSLDAHQLENHNPIRNSLWIKVSDLEFEKED